MKSPIDAHHWPEHLFQEFNPWSLLASNQSINYLLRMPLPFVSSETVIHVNFHTWVCNHLEWQLSSHGIAVYLLLPLVITFASCIVAGFASAMALRSLHGFVIHYRH
jgi:hypothetical protein